MKKIRHYGRKTLSMLLTLIMMFSMLQLTAVAVEPECGKAEHTHTEACKTETRTHGAEHNEDCNPREHVHTASCQRHQHQHTDACGPQGRRTCGYSRNEWVYTCGIEVDYDCDLTEGDTYEAYVCGVEAHEHDEDCYPTSRYTYNHIDIRVNNAKYTLTYNGVDYVLNIGISQKPEHEFYVTVPEGPYRDDGTVVTVSPLDYTTGDGGEYNKKGLQMYPGHKTEDFRISGTVLVPVADVEALPALLKAEFEGMTPVAYKTNELFNGTAGDYYELQINNFAPLPNSNECPAPGTSMGGYDFFITPSGLFADVTDFVAVKKIVVDESGNPIEDDTTDFVFTLGNISDHELETLTLSHGEEGSFSDLTPGAYTVTETEVEGYKPVAYNGTSWDDAPYVQSVQSVQKGEDAEAVTFYNMKLVNKGVLALSKEVEDDTADADYSDETFTFTVKSGDTTVATVNLKDGESQEIILPEGEYTVSETKVVPGNNDGLKVMINGVEDDDAATTVTIEKTETTAVAYKNVYTGAVGALKITKTFEGLEQNLWPNASFTVSGNGYNQTIPYSAFAANGTYTIDGLEPGTYTVTESGAAVTGYDLTTTYSAEDGEVEVPAYATAEIAINNAYTAQPGSLTIIKTATAGITVPANTTFTITGPNGYTNSVTYNQFEGGQLTITGLAQGNYTVTESNAGIEGYTLTVTGNGGVAQTITAGGSVSFAINNAYTRDTGTLTFSKTVAGLPESIQKPNVSFAITGPADFTARTFTYADLAADGTYTLENVPTGEYTVTETGAEVDNYTLATSGTTSATVAKNGTAALSLVNTYTRETGALTITKTFVGLEQAQQPTITFTITGAEYSDTVAYSEFTNGSYTVTVPTGEYTVTESDASVEGYALAVSGDNGATKAVAANAPAATTFAITNTYTALTKGTLKITKTIVGLDDAIKAELAGKLTFTVTGPQYSDSFTYADILAAGGTYTITGLNPGSYTVTESNAAVEGYALAVTGDNGVAKSVTYEQTVNVAITNTYTRELGTLTITKEVSGLQGNDVMPAGTEFVITGPADFDARTITWADFTNGTYTLENVPTGDYTVTEDRGDAYVDGYVLTVTGNGATKAVAANATATFAIANSYRVSNGTLTIIKNVTGLQGNDEMPATTKFVVEGPDDYTATYYWSDFEDGVLVLEDMKPGRYTVTESGAAVAGYEAPSQIIVYDDDSANTSATVALRTSGKIEITNVYNAVCYKVVHAYYSSVNGGEYVLDGESDPVTYGPVVEAPSEEDVFYAQIPAAEEFGDYVYERKSAYAADEVIQTGSLAANTLVYTVKYYRTEWTEGSLIITKTIKGLDEKAERALKADLKFVVTGVDEAGEEIYNKTFSYAEDFSSKGTLTLTKLVPGTYTVEEIGAEIGGGYELTVTSSEEVEVKASPNAAKFNITNEYLSRVYNVWFDGGKHGDVLNPNGNEIDGLWRSHWHNYKSGRSQLSTDDFDWASAELKPGTTVYKYGSGTLYPNLEENPEIEDDTHMMLYTFTWAQWNEHSKKMGISAPDLDTDRGWKSNTEYYVVGADEEIPFTTMADAIEYMNEFVEPDENGFYNVLYMPEYTRTGGGGGGGGGNGGGNTTVEIPEIEVPLIEVPEIELEEEEVPLVELPETDVPKTGDDMMMYVFLTAASAIGLAYMAITGKKREEEMAE